MTTPASPTARRDWPLEVPTTNRLVKYLRAAGFYARRWPATPFGAAGFPDLVVFRGGCVLLVELKTPAGRITKLQEIEFEILRSALGREVLILEVPRVGSSRVAEAARRLACAVAEQSCWSPQTIPNAKEVVHASHCSATKDRIAG